MKETIKKTISSLLLSLILGLIVFGVRYFGVNDQVSTIIATIVIIFSLVFFLTIYRPLLRKISFGFLKDELKATDEKAKQFKTAVSKLISAPESTPKTEIPDMAKVYASFSECEAKMVEELKTARVVKLFTGVGRNDFSKGNKIYDAIIQNPYGDFRFLIADTKSPFVSEAWALKNNLTKEEARTWNERIQAVVNEASYIKNRYHINIKIKGHRYPFVWHFWIIDDRAYVSAFLKRTRAYFTVKVYELNRLDPKQGDCLFEMFDAFFNRIWGEQAYEFDQ
jgi:hypothetical protein